ncbi:malonate--CoA ligase ACSF3, mitochondrial [Aplysia californica]|uniref:Malonate--CoA ligase ACSF3, mitochondrial n=1 Tax=Aplysia californica TaxID=6500 RepID=A0ABM0JDQ7_APLCA|nr:malonate--CoA ligase ACSF3, mitochondrial [Aplysia californica]
MAVPLATIVHHSCQCRLLHKSLRPAWLLNFKALRTSSSNSLKCKPLEINLIMRTERARSTLCLRNISSVLAVVKSGSQEAVGQGHTVSARQFSTSLGRPVHSQDTVQSHLPVFLHAEKYLKHPAVIDQDGSLTYADVLHHSMNLATDILAFRNAENDMKLNSERIAILTDHSVSYVIGQYATWIVNGVSVPLCSTHPPSEWEYFLRDSQCTLVLASEGFVDKITPISQKLNVPVKTLSRELYSEEYEKNRWFQSDHASNPKQITRMFEQRKKRWFDRSEEFILKKPALIVYTSGTTGPPKGVVLTHGNLAAMTRGMIKSWEWTSRDTILHVLPLHHVHGIVNVLLTPLACGATCVMEPKFDPGQVWNTLTSPKVPGLDKNINVFMAVPTVYAKLIQYFDENMANSKTGLTVDFVRETLSSKFRLMVSGSAALPQPISNRWLELSGHRLLERYGMTEIGMALTNPLHGARVPGAVGLPFPEVEVRISKPNVYSPRGYDIIADGNSKHTIVSPGSEEELGDLLVRGPSVFREYWNKPEATAQSFTKDGWFKTGDTVIYKDESYRIVGRTSVDVIKSGGYKISALDVERHLLAHPDIQDCAVVGLPDLTWGQKIAAVLVIGGDKTIELSELREWGSEHLASYQLPTVIKCLESLPRNAMGKVNKKELTKQVFPEFLNQSW